ncbi:MAG: tetratricopeptide repeat protein [Myxococcota bacterium]|nr:tetratricopeptide repeat protein [Myxococcota bacterium]
MSWTTVRREGVFADQLDCETCGAVLGREDWHLPLEPTGPLICRNCGHKRSAGGVCGGCGLSEAEDRQVHQELAEMVAPGMGLLQACNQAADSGRRLLALKLATAAIQDSRRRDLARLMRISLLQDLGLLQAALGECGIWVREGGDHNPMAWALYGELLLAGDRRGEGLEALEQALELAPEDLLTRARYAHHLYDTQRFARARAQAIYVLAMEDDGEAPRLALQVVSRYARRLTDNGDTTAVQELLTDLGSWVETDGDLLAVLAWLRWQEGDRRAAQAALRAAHKIDPDNPFVELLRGPLGIKRWSWFGWGE